jgi:hypothetical protein
VVVDNAVFWGTISAFSSKIEGNDAKSLSGRRVFGPSFEVGTFGLRSNISKSMEHWIQGKVSYTSNE